MLPFYKPRDTPVHGLHPAAKVVMALAMVVVSIVLSHPVYLMAVLVGTMVLAATAHVLREWWSFMRLFILVAITVVVVNAIVSTRGATVLWEGPYITAFGHLMVSLEGIVFGVVMAVRLYTVVSAFTVLSLTVHPDEFTRMLARFAYRSGLAVSLSTRLYPSVVRDASTIVDAQRSRGLDLDSGGRISRIRRRLPVVIPLFHSSLERAVGIAEAMEARGFGSGRRTRWRPRSIGASDALAIGSAVGLLVISVLLFLLADGSPSYYPRIDVPVTTFTFILAVVMGALVVAPALAPAHRPSGGGSHE